MSYETKTFFQSGNIQTIKNFNAKNQLHGISIWFKDNDKNEHESSIEYEEDLINGEWVIYHKNENKKWTVDKYKNNKIYESSVFTEFDSLVEYKKFGEDGILYHDIYCEIVYDNLPFKLILKIEEWRLTDSGYKKTFPDSFIDHVGRKKNVYRKKENGVMINRNFKHCVELLYSIETHDYDITCGIDDDIYEFKKYKYILQETNTENKYCKFKQIVSDDCVNMKTVKKRSNYNDKKNNIQVLSEYAYTPIKDHKGVEYLFYKDMALFYKGLDGEYICGIMDTIKAYKK